MRSSVLAEKTCAFIGLCLFCSMLRAPFFGSLTTGFSPDPTILRLALDGTCIVSGATLILLGLSPYAKAVAEKAPFLLPALAAAGAVGAGIINLSRSICPTCAAPSVAGAALLGIGVSALALCWFRQLSRLSRDETPPFVLGSFVASHVFGLIDFLPREVAANVSILYPALSLAAFVLCEKMRAETPEREPHPVTEINRYFKQLRAIAFALIVAEVLCGAFLRSRWTHGGVSYHPETETVYTYLVSAAIGLLLFAVARRFKSAAEGSLAIGGIGLIILTIATACYATVPGQYCIPFITGLFSSLQAYTLALIKLWRSDGDQSNPVCAGSFVMIVAVSSSISSTIVPTLLSYSGSMPSEYFTGIGIASGLAISVATCGVLFSMVVIQRKSFCEQVRQPLEAHTETPPSPPARIEAPSHPTAHEGATSGADETLHNEALEAIATHFGLTERERETASLVAKGYTAKRVAEELVVATGTVQGYNKSVYRKMGIHRKDELIEAVEQEKRRLADANRTGAPSCGTPLQPKTCQTGQ